MLDAVYWKDAAAVYRLWRSGKKRLVEMTDGDLQKYDDYLHLILVEREFRRFFVYSFTQGVLFLIK